MDPSLGGLREAQLVDQLSRAKQGDPDAWRQLIQTFGPIVLALARRAGLTPDEQEDLFQRTWLTLVERIEWIRRPMALPAWLASTAKRQALAVLRERAATTVGEPDELYELQSSDPTDLLAQVELQAIVRDELALLPGRCRRLLERLFERVEAPDYDEISRELDMPRGSIGPTRGRCLGLLTERLERRGLRSDSPRPASENEARSIHERPRDTCS